MPKRKDWLIIAIALLMALGLFVLTRSGVRIQVPGGDDPLRVLKEIPPASGTQAEPASEEAIAYLVLTVGNIRYRPLPIFREAEYSLRQTDGKENTFHVTRDSVFMETATCNDQSCVKQGTVDLINRDIRVLGNKIICLPNQVVLELITPEEAGETQQ